jgi:hypothetical protein
MSGIGEIVFSPFTIPIVAIIGCTIYGVVAVIAKQWRKAREAEIEAALKADLIKQGRSADEIERVLRMTARKSGEE